MADKTVKGSSRPGSSSGAPDPTSPPEEAIPERDVFVKTPLQIQTPIYTAQVAPAHVVLDRGGFPSTPDEFLWEVIKDRTAALSFSRYSNFVDQVLSDAVPTHQPYDVESLAQILEAERADPDVGDDFDTLENPNAKQDAWQEAYARLTHRADDKLGKDRAYRVNFLGQDAVKANLQEPPGMPYTHEWDSGAAQLRNRLNVFGLFNGDAYQLLKTATEFYVYAEAGRLEDLGNYEPPRGGYLNPEVISKFRAKYLLALKGEIQSPQVLPYLDIIRRRLADLPVKKGMALGVAPGSYGILRSRLASPILVELIWNYWIEQGLMVQTINLVALRFQNVRRGPGVDPLANLEIDPLRPLSNLLWGYLQDELNRLSVQRRAYEYAHGLGLQLVGKAIPEMHAADVRSQFLPAFHDLLRLAWTFFREDDDKTIAADAFPLLNALRELHFVISEGAHNQFGDLPMRARIEMLMQQWILGRPEMREFLRGRTMVPYPEPWMDRVDAMKALQGWNDASVINYADLANLGEQIILSVRYGSWSTTNDQDQAANWARAWRSSIQRYTHALRIVSGIDLSVGDVAEVRTSTERFAQGIPVGRGATPGGTFNFPPAPAARTIPPRPGADKLLRPANPPGVRVRSDGQDG
jgi:hypothetical protein